MINEEQQLKLQAFLDGELPESEARDMAAVVARDSEAAALLAELRHTRQALTNFERDVKLPESREFYWSKIEREIRRLDPAPKPVATTTLFALLWRRLVPISAMAALAVVMVVAVLQFGLLGPAPTPDTETSDTDNDTFTYNDEANGTTLVWLSYPAER